MHERWHKNLNKTLNQERADPAPTKVNFNLVVEHPNAQPIEVKTPVCAPNAITPNINLLFKHWSMNVEHSQGFMLLKVFINCLLSFLWSATALFLSADVAQVILQD